MIRFLEWLADWLAGRKLRKRACQLETCGDRAVFCVSAPADHRKCRTCSKVTASRRLWVDPATLKRRIVPRCETCSALREDRHQSELRTKRTRKDWQQITVPINNAVLDTHTMGEQYTGVVRDAIRAFRHSGESFATVTADVSPSAVQRSIEALGLEKEMYAEQRDQTTVLRRVEGAVT